MYGKTWRTSERKYNVLIERDVKIPMTDGTLLSADVFRPNTQEKCPAILGYFPYNLDMQSAPIHVDSFSSVVFKHPNQEKANASIEAGDPNFYARRGYVHILVNIRGTGKSQGKYTFIGPQELQDGHDVIEWIATQPWCDGQVGMFGVSYFAWIQQYVASTNPPHLKCLFGPWASTDLYRDGVYHGGILNYKFWRNWSLTELSKPVMEGHSRTYFESEIYKSRIEQLLMDEDILATPELVDVLKNPDKGSNPLIIDLLLNPLNCPFWEQRRVDYKKVKVPAYIGGCWGHIGLHLPGAFRSWEHLNVPKKMMIGPPAYLDRPLFQLQYESLRWFDYWMKGIENGIMEEDPIKLWINGANEMKEANDWPLPETKWTPFYLHENGLLSEHEYRVNEGYTSFEDSPWGRGSVSFYTPTFIENTEVIGPLSLTLYASITQTDVLWFTSLWEVDPEGKEELLTRGWLKGSHRELDLGQSTPWQPVHPHTKEEKCVPGEVYEFNIELVPTAVALKAGYKLKLKISCTDDPPKHSMEGIGVGHIRSQKANRLTVYHNEDYPSVLLLPITKGNALGTFRFGAEPYL
jgi:uncharacterized protein